LACDKDGNWLGCEYIKAVSCSQSSPGQCLAGGQLTALPFIHPSLPLSLGISLVYPLFPSSCLPSSFLNIYSSDLPHNTSSQIYYATPLSTLPTLLLLHIPCCTQDQLIYSLHLVFFSFTPLVVVSENGVVFFFSCIHSSICPTFVCF
jgi:hypothetical protein